ncbi:MAG: hypothetical protein M3040_07400 [Bacteroidota bacterium]|nr:hypothetical protein [Bacteroidota bacterium]
MIYKFSSFLELNYQQLELFVDDEKELTKDELLEKCAGEIDYELLQSLKELSFSAIGKTAKGELYLV